MNPAEGTVRNLTLVHDFNKDLFFGEASFEIGQSQTTLLDEAFGRSMTRQLLGYQLNKLCPYSYQTM